MSLFRSLRLKERGRVRDVPLESNELDNGLQIVDWRNTIPNSTYLYSEGDEYEESLMTNSRR